VTDVAVIGVPHGIDERLGGYRPLPAALRYYSLLNPSDRLVPLSQQTALWKQQPGLSHRQLRTQEFGGRVLRHRIGDGPAEQLWEAVDSIAETDGWAGQFAAYVPPPPVSWRHRASYASAAVAGGVAGALLGHLVGTTGMVAGALVGTALGAVLVRVTDRHVLRRFARGGRADSIGVAPAPDAQSASREQGQEQAPAPVRRRRLHFPAGTGAPAAPATPAAPQSRPGGGQLADLRSRWIAALEAHRAALAAGATARARTTLAALEAALGAYARERRLASSSPR
jgi:hypothetical protein